MSKFNQIIDELLLEHSQTYPFPSLDDKEQVKHLMECCDKLGYSEYKDIIKEFFLNEVEPPKPKVQTGKEGESKDFPGKFHLGGGYYSSKENGEAEFKNDKGNLRPVTPEEKAEFEKKSQPSSDSEKKPSINRSVGMGYAKKKLVDVPKQKLQQINQKIENWSEKEKEFFNKGQDNPGSETRRSFAEALRDKVKGAGAAIKHGFQHEVELFKHAAGAAGKLFKGEKLDKEDKKALIKVGIKIATTALGTAALGGVGGGASAFAKHVAVEFVPHVVGETIAVGAARASIFADVNEDERVLMDFADKIAEGLENMDMNPEIMDSIVDKWNNQRTSAEETSETITLDELLESIMLTESEGESSEFPGKYHLGGGYYSSKQDGSPEFKNDNGNLRPITPEEKDEFENRGVGDSKEDELVKTAEKALEDKEKEVEEENEPDPKENPEEVLNDPDASSQDRAKARAFKASKDNLERKKEESGKGTIGEPAKLEPANENTDSNVQKFKGEKSDKEIQTIEFKDGGMMFGTIHRNTKMVDDIIDQIKATIPQEEWQNIVFVGEGGATNDNGELVFHDEMEYATPKFKKLGADIDTWDGDDLDVHNDQSKLYKKQKEKTGLNDSQVKAGNWASMIGQGEGEGLEPNDPENTMKAEDYLDDEGKQFLQDAAKEAGLPPIENFDNPTGEKPSEENGWKGTGDRGTLYRLAFPGDNGDKETKINDIQVAFNETRDENIIEKSKELVKKGKIPIVIAGESHVELVDKMMRGGSDKKSETNTNDGNLPEPEKADETPNATVYNVGGNYYSDTPNGPAQYIKTESVIEKIFIEEDIRFFNLIFESVVTKQDADGNSIKLTVIDPKDQPDATKKADELDSDKSNTNVTPVKGDWENKASNQMNQPKYNNSILDDNLKKSISTIIGKITSGQDLTDEEQQIAKDYIKIAKTDAKVKIYIAAKTKGDWPQGGYVKVELGSGNDKKKWADEAAAKYGVTAGQSSQGAIGKKQISPAKTNPKRKKAKIEVIDDDTIVFNNQKMAKLPVLTFDEIKNQIKSENPGLTEKELNKKAAILERRIRRYNDNIDVFKEIAQDGGGEFEYVDYGDVDTPENRGKAIQSMVDITISDFKRRLGDKADLPENKLVMDSMESLKKFEGVDLETDEAARKEYEQILSDIIVHMTNSKDFRDGVADFAEQKVAMELLGRGYPTYLPSDEAFKTADVLVANPAELSDLSEKSNSLQLLYVTLEFSGGISVKYQGGGAGNSDEKVKKTRFKSNETRKRLNGMLGTYDSMYPNDRTPPNFPPSQEKLDELNATHEDNKKWAIENGIATEDEIAKADEWADKRIEAVFKTFAANGVGDCMSDDEKNRFKENMRAYYRNQKLMEVIYNNDAEYTMFGNSNQKIKVSKGKAVANESDVADGVEDICYMKIKDDVGFNYSKQGDCTVVKPSNRNPSEIHSHKPTIK